MGITYIEGVVKGSNGRQVTGNFLVDNGASYTLLSPEQWKELKLKPKRSMTFTLADGTMISRNISECYISLPQGEAHTPVILGEEGDQPLLGAVTLEILGLTLNPFNRTLQPARMPLA